MIVLGALVLTFFAGLTTTPPEERSATSSAADLPQPSVAYEESLWRYLDSMDEMSGKAQRIASITSSNALSMGWPHDVPNNKGRLQVRQHPRYGVNVYLSIDKGQMVCHHDNCPVRVRFDDGAAITFQGAQGADYSSTTVFILNSKRFIAGARSAKMVRVQFNAYQEGSPILEFGPTDPLRWPTP